MPAEGKHTGTFIKNQIYKSSELPSHLFVISKIQSCTRTEKPLPLEKTVLDTARSVEEALKG